MRFTVACLAGLVTLASAAPVEKRANTLPPVDSAADESVLQLALYLEHLELALYTGGYENFTDAEYTAAGFPADFRENVGVIASVCCLIKLHKLQKLSIESALLTRICNSTKRNIPLPSAPSSRKLATPPSQHVPTRFPTTLLHPLSTSPT